MQWRFRLRKTRERDLERELRAHLDLEAEEQGNLDAARRALGNSALIKEEVRQIWGWMWLERIWQDLRYAMRVLRKSPGFTAVAVLSLALGIGANTALFSLMDAAMLKSLPVRNPNELRILTWVRQQNEGSRDPAPNHSGYTTTGSDGVQVSGSFSYPAYLLFRDRLPQFSDLVAYASGQFNVTARGSSELVNGHYVSGNYFSGLEAQPIAGRAIVTDDDSLSQPMVAVLSYRYWQKRFGSDPSIVGQEVAINQMPTTVVGIMPPLFQGLYPGQEVDLFVPMSAAASERYYSFTDPNTWWVQIFGRLRPGVGDLAAKDAVHSTLAAFITSYAGDRIRIPEVRVMPGARGVGMLRDGTMGRFYVLYVVVGLVLVIACVNLAHLLLARSSARGREMAVRLSIGASRPRLILQLLTENILLAGVGGALGLVVAKPFLALLQQLAFGARPVTLDARLDGRALLFTFAVSVLTAVFAGLLPALRSTRRDLGASLKGGAGATGATSHQYASRALIVAQVAISSLLLVGAGLFVRTLVRLMTVDLGFNTGGVLTFRTDASRSGYKGQRLADIYSRVRERIEAIPGVGSVGLSQHGLMQGVVSNGRIEISGHPAAPGQTSGVYWLECSDSFLATMHIPVLLGRGLAPSDRSGAPLVAVVNETFAKRYTPGENPLGLTISDGSVGALEIVGVVKDARYENVRSLHPTAYIPYTQHLDGTFGLRQMSFAVRTNLPPLSLAQSVRRAVSEVDASIPIAEIRTMQDQIELSTGTEHLMAELAGAFGLAAALLAAIGLYGVMAYTVARRTSEIGIRMALGANGPSVAWLVVRESVWMVAAGLAIGVPSALALSKFVRSMLYGVQANDPWSFAAAVLLMVAVGAAAAWIPARRAAHVDPMTALRTD